MILATPLPFREAIESRQVRQLLPTELRTKLLDTIAPELRERSMFMAGVTNAETLQTLSDGVDEILSGKSDRATVRARLKQLGQRLQYKPAEGEEGSLTDVYSDRRLNLAIDTNLRFAQAYGDREQGRQPEVLDAYPCWELVDTNPALTENRRDWVKRWAEAGGRFFDGRMIARKDDPIWKKISRFGLDYGPLDYGTYHEREDVPADEAIELGVIQSGDRVSMQDRDFNTDLQATPEVRSGALKDALSDQLVGIAQFVGGILKFIGGGRA